MDCMVLVIEFKSCLANALTVSNISNILRIKDTKDECEYEWYMKRVRKITEQFCSLKERRGPYLK